MIFHYFGQFPEVYTSSVEHLLHLTFLHVQLLQEVPILVHLLRHGLADIVGRRLGKGNALPFNPQKSAAGSVAMFVGGWGMSALIVSARVRAHSCASRRARAVPFAPPPRVRFRPLPVADACSVASRVASRRSWCCRPPRPHLS